MVAVLFALHVVPATAQRVRWWQDPAIQDDLALSPQQVSSIEQIYGRTLPERRVLRRRLDREDRLLQDALTRGTLSDAEAQALVNRVEDVRRRRNIARRSMLARIYRVLTPAQRLRLSLRQAGSPSVSSAR